MVDAKGSTPNTKGLPMAPKLLLTPEQAAESLGCGRSYLFRLLSEGQIASVKVGRLRRIPVAEVERYIARLMPAGHKAADDVA